MAKKKNIPVNKFSGFAAENAADDAYYRDLLPLERLKILFQLLGNSEKHNGTIERHIRVYPLTKPEQG
jgi:hypothetical protein